MWYLDFDIRPQERSSCQLTVAPREAGSPWMSGAGL
jgi:hypothetical protein